MLGAKASASLAKDVSIDESELDLVLAILEVQSASGQNTICVRAVGAACSGAVMRVAGTAVHFSSLKLRVVRPLRVVTPSQFV